MHECARVCVCMCVCVRACVYACSARVWVRTHFHMFFLMDDCDLQMKAVSSSLIKTKRKAMEVLANLKFAQVRTAAYAELCKPVVLVENDPSIPSCVVVVFLSSKDKERGLITTEGASGSSGGGMLSKLQTKLKLYTAESADVLRDRAIASCAAYQEAISTSNQFRKVLVLISFSLAFSFGLFLPLSFLSSVLSFFVLLRMVR